MNAEALGRMIEDYMPPARRRRCERWRIIVAARFKLGRQRQRTGRPVDAGMVPAPSRSRYGDAASFATMPSESCVQTALDIDADAET